MPSIAQFLPKGKGELPTWKVHKSRPTRPKSNKMDDYHRSGKGKHTKRGESAARLFKATCLKSDAIREQE